MALKFYFIAGGLILYYVLLRLFLAGVLMLVQKVNKRAALKSHEKTLDK